MGSSPRRSRRAARRWAQHRARMRGSSCSRRTPSGSPCDGADGKATRVDLTYGGLRDSTARFAERPRHARRRSRRRVFALTGRVPELYTAVLGTLRHGSVACVLFSAFGPEPIRQRLELGDARVLVTTSALYRRKIAPIRAELPGLRHVIVIDDEGATTTPTCSRCARFSLERRTPTPSRTLRRPTWPCCTSRAGRPACPRAPSTCTRRSPRTAQPRVGRSTSTTTTSSGARPTQDG